jgi:hypothetical protein
MRWTGHVAGMETIRNLYKLLVGKLEGRISLKDLGTDRRIILKWILGKQDFTVWIIFIL